MAANGDYYATVNSAGSIYLNIEGGYWINLIRDTGIYIKVGLGISKQFEIINEDAVATQKLEGRKLNLEKSIVTGSSDLRVFCIAFYASSIMIHLECLLCGLFHRNSLRNFRCSSFSNSNIR